MTVVEIASYSLAPQFTNNGKPNIFKCLPAHTSYDDFWTVIFGSPDDSVTERKKVIAYLTDASNRYVPVLSEEDMEAQTGSFYWDQETQELIVNYVVGDNNFDPLQTYGGAIGFTDSTGVKYFDDVEYLPMLSKAPQYEKAVDFLTYGELSRYTGSMTLSNGDDSEGKQAVLDYLIGSNIYGNEVFVKYGNEGDAYNELVPVNAFSVEDYGFTLNSITIRLKDIRESQNVNTLEETYTQEEYPNLSDDDVGKFVPLIYGPVKNAPCLCVNKSLLTGTTRRYRAGLILTELTSVEVRIDEVWTARTPENIDLSTGEFDVPLAVNSSGAAYECRANCTGIENDGPHDVILDINQRRLGLDFNDSNYFTAEWYSEVVSFEPIGLIVSEQKKLFAFIADLQGKSNIGFFYDIDGLGRRTIRLDNPNRDPAAYVQFCEIMDNDELRIETDSTDVYAKVNVKYEKNWQAGASKSVTDQTYFDSVRVSYKSKKELSVDSYLLTSDIAEERAAIDAETYSQIRPTVELSLMGKAFFALRTTDIITAELTPGFVDADADTSSGRTYFGLQRCQITSFTPDYESGTVKINARLLPYSELFDDLILQTTPFELEDGMSFELETDEPFVDYFTVTKE